MSFANNRVRHSFVHSYSYNLNHLTEWLRDQNLQESGASDCLLPLTQAVQLFLCKKDEASISNVCTKLTIVQVKTNDDGGENMAEE